mmetsp:Transcript_37918/g.118274  ORF Transcript_37918/g.118274 Transcript_37918/m.118274 type:complete len:201 (+) Transcript_37918:506-1108(+)
MRRETRWCCACSGLGRAWSTRCCRPLSRSPRPRPRLLLCPRGACGHATPGTLGSARTRRAAARATSTSAWVLAFSSAGGSTTWACRGASPGWGTSTASRLSSARANVTSPCSSRARTRGTCFPTPCARTACARGPFRAAGRPLLRRSTTRGSTSSSTGSSTTQTRASSTEPSRRRWPTRSPLCRRPWTSPSGSSTRRVAG